MTLFDLLLIALVLFFWWDSLREKKLDEIDRKR